MPAPRYPTATLPLPLPVVTRQQVKKRRAVLIHKQSETTYAPSPSELQNVPHVARVRTTLKMTKAMGDFESMSIEVSIDSPCLPDEESKKAQKAEDYALADQFVKDDAFNFSSTWFNS